jgi:hypothetical protein
MRTWRLWILAVALAGGTVAVQRFAFAATNFNVSNNGAVSYLIDANPTPNPSLTLTRGQTYTFTANTLGHPFWIVTARGAADVMTNAVSTGVDNNGTLPGNGVGTVTFAVPGNAPATLFYQCGVHNNMGGMLNIVSPPVPASGPVGLAVLAGLLLLVAAVSLRRTSRRRT